jgi:hypothetical protein
VEGLKNEKEKFFSNFTNKKYEANVLAPGGLFLYLGIHRRTAGMGTLFD